MARNAVAKAANAARSAFQDGRVADNAAPKTFADVRSGFADVRWGFADVRSGFADVRWGFADVRWGFADARSGGFARQ